MIDRLVDEIQIRARRQEDYMPFGDIELVVFKRDRQNELFLAEQLVLARMTVTRLFGQRR